ncbi:MAG: hypothetical protein AB1641_12360 [Thermodesulfobacteriota bacterium]
MSDKPVKAIVQKICLDNECATSWNSLPPEFAKYIREFVYCPYCSEELHLMCSACRESLANKDFKFCPWCGASFSD